MAAAKYREEMDLIQNCRNLFEQVEICMNKFGTVEPAMNQILALKTRFEQIASETTATIDLYKNELTRRGNEYDNLITNCKSQFRQVTNDVESLVNLQVNFSDIKDKILECLSLADTVNNIVKGPYILMPENGYVAIQDRIPYKHYAKIVESIDLDAMTGHITGRYVVAPNLAFSYDTP